MNSSLELFFVCLNWEREYLSHRVTKLVKREPGSPGGPSPTLQDSLPETKVNF